MVIGSLTATSYKRPPKSNAMPAMFTPNRSTTSFSKGNRHKYICWSEGTVSCLVMPLMR